MNCPTLSIVLHDTGPPNSLWLSQSPNLVTLPGLECWRPVSASELYRKSNFCAVKDFAQVENVYFVVLFQLPPGYPIAPPRRRRHQEQQQQQQQQQQ